MEKNKKKLIAGIILFGSLWGFSEVLLGSTLENAGISSGGIMTGFFAITFLVASKIFYRQPGIQLGMGLIAGGLRIFNPFVGCQICSAIAIMVEGAVFELIWYKFSFDIEKYKTYTIQMSMGILTAFLLYVSGYIITQILTPILAGSGFYFENLIIFMPRILANGLLPALIGAFMVPVIMQIKKLDLTIKDDLYYPATISISVFCWIFVISIWFMMA